MSSWVQDATTYVGRVRQFNRTDWWVYGAWVGLMIGLACVTGALVLTGYIVGAPLPEDTVYVPLGATTFAAAIGVDTIGHRTIYRDALASGEALVHHVTIFLGITSCLILCLGYAHPEAAFVPAAVLTALSFFYASIDEAMHWRRYLADHSDRIEMWSHVFIFIGHGIMMLGWWRWYMAGYPGVAETLRALSLA